MSMKFDEERPEAYHWRMNTEARIERLEDDVVSIKVDIAFLKANSATKADIAELKALIAESKSSIIMWVMSAIILGQLLPSLLKLFTSG
ncbi:hypothetical protein [Duganella levis]|uniref:DUF1640 domain-containing protein n=1 Tax=Duganella levis TaxID=2692169 RepID=A0ABW9VV02_9BURK|nr:hypothetical protein [Duganella levis]MYN25466.1 hypothetical protein [Duganella levis]